MSADAAAPSIGLIWAEARGGVIGRDGGMPWHVPEDLAHFKDVTLGAPVVMGRKTWDSLPAAVPARCRAARNIVVTRRPTGRPTARSARHSVDDALALAASRRPSGSGSSAAPSSSAQAHRRAPTGSR